MNEDLISNNFGDSINKAIIKKTFTLSRVVLAFTIIYSSLELLSWYFTLSILAGTNLVTAAAYFSYRITPMIHVILLSMSVISSSYVVKANKMIDLSFEKNDA